MEAESRLLIGNSRSGILSEGSLRKHRTEEEEEEETSGSQRDGPAVLVALAEARVQSLASSLLSFRPRASSALF